MHSPIARVLHLNFKKTKECDFWLLRHEKDAKDLEKSVLQRTVIKIDDKSLIIISLFENEADADKVFKRFVDWTAEQVFFDDGVEKLHMHGTVVYNVVYSKN